MQYHYIPAVRSLIRAGGVSQTKSPHAQTVVCDSRDLEVCNWRAPHAISDTVLHTGEESTEMLGCGLIKSNEWLWSKMVSRGSLTKKLRHL